MRPTSALYPVDRYLITSGKMKMVNIIDEEIWHPEPAMRPEDELMLRKLHEMLQSTADDLKELTGELTKYHEPGVQVKITPTPLDDDFNEKVHVEELVNAKFHGYTIVDKPKSTKLSTPNVNQIINDIRSDREVLKNKCKSTGVQVDTSKIKSLPHSILKKSPIFNTNISAEVTQPNFPMKIKSTDEHSLAKPSQTIKYKEFVYESSEKEHNIPKKILNIQTMPSINIRSALTEQKVIQLDIKPEKNEDEISEDKKNSVIIEMKHKHPSLSKAHFLSERNVVDNIVSMSQKQNSTTMRKTSKMSSYESSDSTTNISSETKISAITDNTKKIKKSPKVSKFIAPQPAAVQRSKSNLGPQSRHGIEEWKHKLDSVYSAGASKINQQTKKTKPTSRKVQKQPHLFHNEKKRVNVLNNSEYIPYSKLTLGGVRLTDVEQEISTREKRNDMPLSPIIDKILSRENSVTLGKNPKDKSKILTTSDENLLQEVLDVEKDINYTIAKNFTQSSKRSESYAQKNFIDEKNNEDNDNISYDDDFEDDIDQSDVASNVINQESLTKSGSNEDVNICHKETNIGTSFKNNNTSMNKQLNLSFKNTVDIFEYVHSINMQDNATQSSNVSKISLKETQTSPRNDECASSSQPIHNVLWPTIDPKGELDKLLSLEKDFIKKIIFEEYGDLIKNNVSKPSSSNNNSHLDDVNKNIAALQKNTQTSPARVKAAMTSPARTMTRTTSPFPIPNSITVNRQTSPLIIVDKEDVSETGITINLDSPRFTLKLPQSSREVLSNYENYGGKSQELNNKTFIKETVDASTLSSSADVEASSSDLSSLGEVKLKLRRKNRKNRVITSSESSSSSIIKSSAEINSGGILPLRSEGEASSKQFAKSEGEISLGQLRSEGESNTNILGFN